MSELLSRKFLYAVLATILGFALVMMGRLGAEAFIEFVKIIGATYVVGNIASKAVTK